jgi:hypothetical protein
MFYRAKDVPDRAGVAGLTIDSISKEFLGEWHFR